MDDQRIKLDKAGIPSCCLNGTVMNKNKIKNDVLANKFRLVYTTPEYMVTQDVFLGELNKKKTLLAVAIDEAHCCSAWSDFRKDYLQLGFLKEFLPQVPIMALTATATLKVQNDIIQTLKLKKPLIIKTTFDRPNLNLSIYPKSDIITDILPYLKDEEPAIVYCRTRKDTDKVAALLQKHKVNCAGYHAGMKDTEREYVHSEFVENKIKCIVATVAFGMGIDKPIRKVIHYGVPMDIESYYQEIGRAGRDGLPSMCIIFYANKDFETNNFFVNQITNSVNQLNKSRLLGVMKKYIYTTDCRRKYILAYFDEEYEKDNCNNCDNCIQKLKNIKQVSRDFTKDAVLLLHTIYETGSVYGSGMIINILVGSTSKKIPYEFKKLEVYSRGTNHSADWWKVFIRMLININFIKESPISGGFGMSLCRTVKARKWLQVVTLQGIRLLQNIKDEDKLIMEIPKEMLGLNKPKPLPEPKIKTKQKSKPKTNPKPNTTEMITHALFEKGLSISEIAKKRKIKELTVEDHLIKVLESEENINLDAYDINDELYNKISSTIIALKNPTKLRTIKKHLPPKISYLQIRVVQMEMKKNTNNTNNPFNDSDNESQHELDNEKLEQENREHTIKFISEILDRQKKSIANTNDIFMSILME